jgi:hypothetical protein
VPSDAPEGCWRCLWRRRLVVVLCGVSLLFVVLVMLGGISRAVPEQSHSKARVGKGGKPLLPDEAGRPLAWCKWRRLGRTGQTASTPGAPGLGGLGALTMAQGYSIDCPTSLPTLASASRRDCR